jgi:uncharacterized protein YjeT (DUF2065 family)
MIKLILLGLGFAAIIDGLVLALAPLRFEDLVRALSEMTVDQRRMLGLAVAVIGFIIISFAAP